MTQFTAPLFAALAHRNYGENVSLNFGDQNSEQCMSFMISMKRGQSPQEVTAELRRVAEQIDSFDYDAAMVETAKLLQEASK